MYFYIHEIAIRANREFNCNIREKLYKDFLYPISHLHLIFLNYRSVNSINFTLSRALLYIFIPMFIK